ncbi:MAG: hypothetical protein ACK2TX_07355 [Anaerolineales bacterium]
MERLSNEEFEKWITRIKAGGKIPADLDEEDRSNLQLASRFLLYRIKAPLEIFGTSSERVEVSEIMLALDRLRPTEKKIIYAYLIGGFPIDVVASLTYRSPHHCINSLRSGLSSLRKLMNFDKSHNREKKPDYSPIS